MPPSKHPNLLPRLRLIHRMISPDFLALVHCSVSPHWPSSKPIPSTAAVVKKPLSGQRFSQIINLPDTLDWKPNQTLPKSNLLNTNFYLTQSKEKKTAQTQYDPLPKNKPGPLTSAPNPQLNSLSSICALAKYSSRPTQ